MIEILTNFKYFCIFLLFFTKTLDSKNIFVYYYQKHNTNSKTALFLGGNYNFNE